MSSFMDSLKSALLQPEQSDPSVVPTATKTLGSVSTAVSAPSANADMVAAIRKAVFARNTALTAVLQAADNLSDVIPDPTMRLKAAAKSTGRDARSIQDAIKIHLSDVDGEELRFNQALQAKSSTELGTLQQTADNMKRQVEAAQAEIDAAQKRIADLTASISSFNAQQNEAITALNTRKQELTIAESQFKAAAGTVRAELATHQSTISSTLV